MAWKKPPTAICFMLNSRENFLAPNSTGRFQADRPGTSLNYVISSPTTPQAFILQTSPTLPWHNCCTLETRRLN